MPDAANPFDFEQMSVAERLVLVERIWESIERDRANSPLTDEQRTELDRRLAAYKASGDPGVTWEEVEARLNRAG
jgi:putative addiction module component (TIGR02574 family)